jgi:uncharacterized delta-60 repeat protein
MTYLPLPSRKFLFALFILFFFPFLLIGQQIDKDFGDKGFLLSNYTSPHSQFGHGTIRTLSHGGYMLAGDHAVDQIGVQLITDAFRQIWFRRMKADGNPDTSFGNNGLKVHTIKDKFDAVITHQYADRGQYFFILREPTLDYHIYIFDENGEPDSLYGQNGIVAIPTLTGTMARMQSIHCKSLPNGDIIVAFLAFKESIIWYKLKPDGTIDNSFGNNGNRSLMDNSVISIKRLKVYGDSLIVTLTTHSGTGNFTSKLFVQSTDGLADTTFNQSGERDCPSSSDLHRFSDGRICVLSSTDISMYDKQGVQLARKFFYSLPQFPTESYLNRMGVDLQGRLLLSGDSQENLFCARLDQDFDIDTAFGNQGYQRFMPLGNPIRSYIGIDRQLAVSLDQWMVLMSRHGVAKLDSTGMLDSDFGLQGVEPLYKPVSSIAWEEICQDSKGKVWTAGMNLDHEIVIGKFDLQQNKQELQFTIPPHEEQDWYNPDIVTDMVAMPDDGFLLMGTDDNQGIIRKFTETGEPDSLFTEVREYQQISQPKVFPSGNFLAIAKELRTEGALLRQPFAHIHKYYKDGTRFAPSDFQFRPSLYQTDIDWRRFHIRDMFLLSNGGFFLVGQRENRWGFYVRKSLPDGRPDSTFGDFGWTYINVPWSDSQRAFYIEQMDDGKLMIGSSKGYVRLLADGSRDNSFHNNGFLDADFDFRPLGYSSLDRATLDYARLPDGSYMLYGMVRFNRTDKPQMYLVHYLENGQRNQSFGNKGYFLIDHPGRSDVAFDLLVQSDTSLILSGFSNESAILVRIESDQFRGPMTSIDEQSIVASAFKLYPNPTSSHHISLQYELRNTQTVGVELYQSNGQLIKSLFNEIQAAGSTTLRLDLPVSLSRGIYLLKLSTDTESHWKKLILK